METPLVSICIPTFNGEKFLKSCLDSAIGQTYKNIEIIINDDNSSDKTYEIAKGYADRDSRIKLYCNEKNLGLVGNWNKCIELSKGSWVKFLFQDDYFSKDCVVQMVNALSPNDKIVSSRRRLILDESLDEVTKKYSINETLTFEKLGILSEIPVYISPEKISVLAVQNISMNFIGEPTVIMFKKECIDELGPFNSDLIQICDLEYFLRIACKYGVKYVPKQLTYFRVHKGSASSANFSERVFSMKNFDPIIMVHQLLYDKQYSLFRNALNGVQKIKLKLFFESRVYESYQSAMRSPSNNLEKFEYVALKYPEIGRLRKGSFYIRALFVLVKMRRGWRKKCD